MLSGSKKMCNTNWDQSVKTQRVEGNMEHQNLKIKLFVNYLFLERNIVNDKT